MGKVEVGHPQDRSALQLPCTVLNVPEHLEARRFVELHVFFPTPFVLLLLVVDLLDSLALRPQVLELGIVIAEVEKVLLMGGFALLLGGGIDLRLVEIDHQFPSNLLVDDLLDVWIVGEVLVLLKDLH
jgi:hypothetical protein